MCGISLVCGETSWVLEQPLLMPRIGLPQFRILTQVFTLE
jgi:hypothetical protein